MDGSTVTTFASSNRGKTTDKEKSASDCNHFSRSPFSMRHAQNAWRVRGSSLRGVKSIKPASIFMTVDGETFQKNFFAG
jgi:hypothetical protein